MENLSDRSHHEFKIFKRQYMQLHAELQYPSAESLRQDSFQQALQDRVFGEDAMPYHPPERYQLRVLKELMKRIESSIEDWDEEGISDDLMSRLSVLLASPIPSELTAAQQKAYVTYSLALIEQASTSGVELRGSMPTATITLLESRNLVAASGTTGLRTWEACLQLGNYLCSPDCPVTIANKSVLELGTGTGYLAVLCAKYLDASHVIASDGAETVVADLPTNFFLNGLQDDSRIEAYEFLWGHPLMGGEEQEWKSGRQIDVVLGADVTYDGRSISALVASLEDVVELFPHVEVIISATIRNENTFETFLRICEKNNFIIEELDYPIPPFETQEGPFYTSLVPIRICKLSKVMNR